MENVKTCSMCKDQKPIDAFGSNQRSKDGHQHMCRECHKVYWHKKNIDRMPYLSRRQKFEDQKMPERARARKAARKAVKKGFIQPPELCSMCGKEPWYDMHHDDYEKPLAVKFLCRGCHKLVHYREEV